MAGVLPFRFRKRELCCREYARIKCKDENHLLVKLFKSSTRARMRFCPLEYIRVVSKELERAISGCNIRRRNTLSVAEITSEDRIFRRNIDGIDTLLLTPYSYGNSNNINRKEDICIKEALFEFLSCVDRRIWLVMNTHMFLPLVDISLGWISPSIYISLYKCCIYKIDTRLILADCDLQQQPWLKIRPGQLLYCITAAFLFWVVHSV